MTGISQTPPARLERWYLAMLRIRRAEEWIGAAVSRGEIVGPCHLCIGQEAVAVGVCDALLPRDSVWGAHRSHGHYLAKGGDLTQLIAEVLGQRSGCTGGRGGSMHLMAPDVGIRGTVPIVAGTIPLAVGAAFASKVRGDGNVAVAFFGDGATEQGHFAESLNLAALYRLPVVFVCENNLYSSHLPLAHRRANPDITATAVVAGVPAVTTDGNDVEAVFHAASAAVARGRAGEGPSLIEALTYRLRGHVGPGEDLHVGESRAAELLVWHARDPIIQVRERLLCAGVSSTDLHRADAAAADAVCLAAAQASAHPEVVR